MDTRRFVFIDPDGTDDRWLYVVAEAPTGVIYQQQYGGTACRQGEVEGYLVPVTAPDALDGLRVLFERDLRGAGARDHRWADEQLAGVRRLVGGVPYWTGDGDTEEPHPLRLDESRVADLDEAWVPVLTPDGPGVLVWLNSD
ncbi:DUF6210 family protein [Thermomonospora umbrina]|uniref:Uncharacterized protein n=1 Tax=Thermomonospora umbrina TaxID=111806 RepID=A0A3D9SL12_9ACTN|nr:DUF6210 family protein [Thermomonospora umbrina]REE96397.1 hypothetical protein DFJ69_1830 [Thermomonospora umbrina]